MSCQLRSCQVGVRSCHVASCHGRVSSRRVRSVVSGLVLSCRVVSCQVGRVEPCLVVSCRVASIQQINYNQPIGGSHAIQPISQTRNRDDHLKSHERRVRPTHFPQGSREETPPRPRLFHLGRCQGISRVSPLGGASVRLGTPRRSPCQGCRCQALPAQRHVRNHRDNHARPRVR